MAERREAEAERPRLAVFLGALAVLGAAEALAPARPSSLGRRARWPVAAGLALAAGVVGRVIPPAGLAGAASWAERRRFGLLNRVALPAWLAWTLSLAALDLAVWAQHVASHRHPGFWRLHRVHHSDPEVDVSTGVRFHPAEIAVSALWKAGVVVALGAPPAAALAFEAWLSTGALFSHADLRLPRRLDAVLRRAIVTPNAHRLHHRTGERESRVNYGFGLSAWDQLFGKFAPGEAGVGTRLGVGDGWREARDQRLGALLLQPLAP